MKEILLILACTILIGMAHAEEITIVKGIIIDSSTGENVSYATISLFANGINTMSKFGDETSISKYVREQGVEKEYKQLHKETQLRLF